MMARCVRQAVCVVRKTAVTRVPASQKLTHILSTTPPNPHCVGFHRRYCSTFGPDKYQTLTDEIQKQLKPPEFFNLFRDIVAPWAQIKPEHPALYVTDGGPGSVMTYRELLEEAQILSKALSQPQPPKCALVFLPKVPQWWVINVAAAHCGTVLSPGTTQLTARDVVHRLAESGADCIICTDDLAADLDQATTNIARRIVLTDGPGQQVRSGWESYNDLVERGRQLGERECVTSRGNDVTQLFFTSGTTGRPKMVPHTHTSYGIGHIATTRYWLDLKEDDVLWNISDTGWAKAAWSSLYIPLMAGATAFVHQMNRFDADEALRTLVEDRVTVLCAPPTAYRALVQCRGFGQRSLGTLRHCVSAGEPLNPEVMHEWSSKTGLSIYDGYGQSETTLLAGVCRGMKLRPGSMGKPAPGYTLKVLDDSQQEVGPHQEGHLAVSLKNGHPIGLFKGYLNNDERTKEVFIGDYYLTGDKAYYDEDGYFWFVSRADDVIISSGYRIGPFEVESSLLEHPAVAESAVVSSPDSLRGEVVKAFVVLAEGHKNQDLDQLRTDLQRHVKHNTAPYKYPRKIEFVASLPKTVSGKIRRVELRSNEWSNK